MHVSGDVVVHITDRAMGRSEVHRLWMQNPFPEDNPPFLLNLYKSVNKDKPDDLNALTQV